MCLPGSTVCLILKASMLKPWVTLVSLPTLITTLSPLGTLIGVAGVHPVPPSTGTADTDLWVVCTPHAVPASANAETGTSSRKRARFIGGNLPNSLRGLTVFLEH